VINKKSHFGTFGLITTPIIVNQMPFWSNSKNRHIDPNVVWNNAT
jgi:hypothetical protein